MIELKILRKEITLDYSGSLKNPVTSVVLNGGQKRERQRRRGNVAMRKRLQ